MVNGGTMAGGGGAGGGGGPHSRVDLAGRIGNRNRLVNLAGRIRQ